MRSLDTGSCAAVYGSVKRGRRLFRLKPEATEVTIGGRLEPKVTIPALQQMKRTGQKIVGVVVYDYQMAQIVDRAGVDIVSVGDSVGVNLWGQSSELEVTLEQMILACRARLGFGLGQNPPRVFLGLPPLLRRVRVDRGSDVARVVLGVLTNLLGFPRQLLDARGGGGLGLLDDADALPPGVRANLLGRFVRRVEHVCDPVAYLTVLAPGLAFARLVRRSVHLRHRRYPFARGRRREPLHPPPKTSTCSQNPGWMPHLRLIEVGEATGELKRQYEAAIQRAGKVFNIVKSMSLRPGVLEPSMELYKAIMFGPSELSRAERELLAVVVSRANDCHY
jgi:hypothetical protein